MIGPSRIGTIPLIIKPENEAQLVGGLIADSQEYERKGPCDDFREKARGMEKGGKVRCQRFGCDAFFSEDHNPEGSCSYHPSGPVFRDGMKEWSCCKKRSHDFGLFLEIPGCQTGKHTSEKPVIEKATCTPKKPLPSPTITSTSNSSKEDCPRCKQGFFCSDHGSQAKQVESAKSTPDIQKSSPPMKKIVDINEPQTCKNKGCGKTFKEKDNHETACSYHPGPAVFHDRMKGWRCCDINVKEFDEFMSIPPCTQGWHNGDPTA